MWRDFLERLATATGRPTVAWLRRRGGKSVPLESARALDDMHRDADALLKSIDSLSIACCQANDKRSPLSV